jgi:hypothetical protein
LTFPRALRSSTDRAVAANTGLLLMSATSIGLRGGRDDAKDEEDEDPFSDSMADFLTAIADTDDEDENAEKAARPRQPPSHEDDATTEIGSHQARAPEPAGPAVGAGQAEEHGMSEHENNAGAAVAEPEILPSNFINVPARGLYGEGPVNGDAKIQGEEEEEEVQSGADAGIDLASIRAVAKEEVERGHILDDILGPTSVAEGELHREDVGKGLDAFVVEGLVDSEEAAALIRATESLGFSFWNPCSNRTDYRNSDTIEVTNQRLADALYARVRHLVPPRVTISPGNARWSKELEGEWVAVGINPVMLFNRYGPGGHFSPHTDGYTIVDFNTRSMYSTLVYLNDCPDGGATRMMEESGDATDKECFVKCAPPARPRAAL